MGWSLCRGERVSWGLGWSWAVGHFHGDYIINSHAAIGPERQRRGGRVGIKIEAVELPLASVNRGCDGELLIDDEGVSAYLDMDDIC